jgi:hypothetical protein
MADEVRDVVEGDGYALETSRFGPSG